ncbi:MAG: hypothetical protein WEB90_06675 [Gemmatimonadota bacterium]
MVRRRLVCWRILACSVVYAIIWSPPPVAAQEPAPPDRGGFTLLLDAGLGFQRDGYFGRTEAGFTGLNLGIGGFLTRDLALLFRVSGTTVDYDGLGQTSGVGGPTAQLWLNDRLHLAAGLGIGFWAVRGLSGESSDPSFGLILGAGYLPIAWGRHALRFGVEYAPAFTQPNLVHNLALSLGWQWL